MSSDNGDDTEQGMSRTMSARFEATAGEVLNENGGGMVTAIVGLVEYVTADGGRAWATITLDHQSPTDDLGMTHFQLLSFEHDINAYLNRIGEP